MADLVREIMIDATPETIWPFLTDAGKVLARPQLIRPRPHSRRAG